MSDLFKIGDILRYDHGPTALMRVTYVSKGHGGSTARYYGQQCMSGSCGAYHNQVQIASPEDRKKWFEVGRETDAFGHRHRKTWSQLRKHDHGIVRAVED